MSRKDPIAHTRHITAMLRAATPDDLRSGIAWYNHAARSAADISGRARLPMEATAAVIAALSPRNNWDRNVADATAVCRAYYTGGHDAALQTTVSTFGRNLRKAVAILDNADKSPDDFAAILSGRKVTSFYWNILGNHNPVTVDGHAYSIWSGRRIPLADTPKIGPPLYRTISRAYRLVASRSTSIVGQPLTPAQVQAVTWTTYRRLHGLDK